MGLVPRPGTTPYREALTALRFRLHDGSERLVYVWSLRDGKAALAGELAAGAETRLRLTPWDEAADELETIRRLELEDDPGALALPAYVGERAE